MNTKTILKALSTETGSPIQSYILIKLASIADESETTSIGITKGAEFCGVHVETFKTHIRALSEAGYLSVSRGSSFQPATFSLQI